MFKLFGHKTDPKKALLDVLGECDLPSFPAVVTTALEKIRDDDASSASIADILATDPGLTVHLLGTVDSAAFALRHTVRNVHHAISLLGRNQLESMLLSLAVGDSLPRSSMLGFDATRFWETAARRATLGRALADRIDPATRSESFTAALLQDLAVPILSMRKGQAYGELLEHWHNSTDDLAQLEERSFGWDHANVALWICQEWKFPPALADSIGAHHDTGGDGLVGLPAVNLVASLREINEQAGFDRLIESARSRHGIPEDETRAMIESSQEDAREIAQLFA